MWIKRERGRWGLKTRSWSPRRLARGQGCVLDELLPQALKFYHCCTLNQFWLFQGPVKNCSLSCAVFYSFVWMMGVKDAEVRGALGKHGEMGAEGFCCTQALQQGRALTAQTKAQLPELWSWELPNQRNAESPGSSRRAISNSSFKNKSNGCRRNKTPKDRQWLCALKQLSAGCFLAWSHCFHRAQPTQVLHTLYWAAFFTGGGFTCPFGERKCYLLHV